MLRTLFTTSALLLAGTAAFAAPATPVKAHAPASLVCPVTGEKIASVKDAAGHSTYQGKTYYFCCSSCKPEFDKHPAKYAKTVAAVSPAHLSPKKS